MGEIPGSLVYGLLYVWYVGEGDETVTLVEGNLRRNSLLYDKSGYVYESDTLSI